MTSAGTRGAALPVDGSVVVIGASLAGLRTVQALRDDGFRGRIVLVGDEAHEPYDRPPLSKQVLAGDWPPERIVLADRAKLDALGVELRLGRQAVGLDAGARRVTFDDGTTLDGDGIVLATGARPRRLAGTEDLDGVQVLRTVEDTLALRARIAAAGPGARVVVVGAGFIGSEVAATCSGLGCRVTVLEALATPLAPALGELVGGAVAALHARHGVGLRTGAAVAAIHPPAPMGRTSGGGEAQSGKAESRKTGSRQPESREHESGEPESGQAGRVALADGTSVPADAVVVGIGVVPNTEWLEGSGLTVRDGVVCDPALFAADGVVAAGDVARWAWRHAGEERSVRIEHWEVAAQMGGAAARSLLAGRSVAESFDPVPYFWSDQYGLRIQVLGRPEPDDEVAVVHGSLDADDGKFVALYGRGGRLAAALAISRPRQLMAFRPLLVAGASWGEALDLLGA